MSNVRMRLANGKRPLVIAHRGVWSERVPENSREAISATYLLGCDIVEIDIRLSADGEPMVMHDKTLLRTTGNPSRVSELPAKDLQDIRLLESSETIPHLDEALAAGGDTLLFDLDVKEEADLETVAYYLRDRRERVNCMLKMDVRSSDDIDRLVNIERLYDITVIAKSLLATQVDLALIESMSKRKVAAAEANFANLDILKEAAKTGLPLTSYTLNDVHCAGLSDDVAMNNPHRVWGALAEAGLRGIITDRPRELSGFLTERDKSDPAIFGRLPATLDRYRC